MYEKKNALRGTYHLKDFQYQKSTEKTVSLLCCKGQRRRKDTYEYCLYAITVHTEVLLSMAHKYLGKTAGSGNIRTIRVCTLHTH
jgi:hypothetical protein